VRLSCGNSAFPLLSVEQSIRLIGLLDFDGVDIVLMGNSAYLRPEEIALDVADADVLDRRLGITHGGVAGFGAAGGGAAALCGSSLPQPVKASATTSEDRKRDVDMRPG